VRARACSYVHVYLYAHTHVCVCLRCHRYLNHPKCSMFSHLEEDLRVTKRTVTHLAHQQATIDATMQVGVVWVFVYVCMYMCVSACVCMSVCACVHISMMIQEC
jgi:hypothetical protein